jgi:integrase
VRELERARDAGTVTRTGRSPVVAAYLAEWLAGSRARVKVKTWIGYDVDIRVHVVPVIGGKQLAQLKPEDIEKVYVTMTDRGSSPATVAHVRRTLSKALGDAAKRGYLPRNPVPLAAAPKVEETEIEPLTEAEARRVLAVAEDARNGAAWVIALSLGLRRGEVLGLRWDDVDTDADMIRVRRALQRHPWRHGCAGAPCGRRAAACTARHGGGLHLVTLKSAAGRRDVALPEPLAVQLRAHRHRQLAERLAAGERWRDEHDLVFTQPDGAPTDPDAHGRAWHAILAAAGVRPARLHDARHTAATLLLVQGVDARVVMEILGWSTAAMAKRYQHVVPELRRLAAERMTAALWPTGATGTAR